MTPVVLRALLLGLLVCLGAGCRTTQPWQREELARKNMRPKGDPDRRALREHMMGTREGAVGGVGGGGGGCGCN